MNKLYLGRINGWNDNITEVEVTQEDCLRYWLGENSYGEITLYKNYVNENISDNDDFEMFSESKEYLIEQMREYVSNEIKKANKRILDLQNSFQKVLDENEN